jgi:hypothetical protein
MLSAVIVMLIILLLPLESIVLRLATFNGLLLVFAYFLLKDVGLISVFKSAWAKRGIK